ncbi:hypothetical protein SDC9_180207 [bioreactor metagenome]|uniref:Uncharacterized protein n=1 Tax=bioreactor metagenome TaxID=1076179 RepID=A0A645H125_9ZZZZ
MSGSTSRTLRRIWARRGSPTKGPRWRSVSCTILSFGQPLGSLEVDTFIMVFWTVLACFIPIPSKRRLKRKETESTAPDERCRSVIFFTKSIRRRKKNAKRTKSIQTPLILSVHFLPAAELILFVLLDTKRRNIMNVLSASQTKLSSPSTAASAILKKIKMWIKRTAEPKITQINGCSENLFSYALSFIYICAEYNLPNDSSIFCQIGLFSHS